MRHNEIGCCRVWLKEDPDSFILHPRYYEDLKRAWMAGETFFTAKDCYESEVIIRLAAVVAITITTPETIAVWAEDKKANVYKEDV
jgi:hypothetical protein